MKPIFFVLFLVVLFSACKKYLDEKPVKASVVPSTLDDLQALLDNQGNVQADDAGLTEMVSDNYYITDATYQTLNLTGAVDIISNLQHYLWDGQAIPWANGWIKPYQGKVYTANIVLDYIDKVEKNADENSTYGAIKGSALFLRAFAFERLAQVYCKPYDASSATTDPGIVLRTTSDITAPSVRGTVQQSYDMVIADLKEAALLLPTTTTYPTRPNKAAAYGELARTYLSMRQYDSAGRYADLALQLNSELLDYNTLIPTTTPVFPLFHKEIIFYSSAYNSILMGNNFAKIDSNLARSYDANDLRKECYFKSSTYPVVAPLVMWGSYWRISPAVVFDGITTGELYLVRAECAAKAGNTSAAMTDLNTLMQMRWKSSAWSPFTASNATEALQQIRTERRKELVYRGLRWSDVRRYNLEDSAITLKRVINGTTYTLPPNDKRSVMLIPWEVVNLSGIQQNPR